MNSNKQTLTGSKNQNVEHPDGGFCYGVINEARHNGELIYGGEIFLRVGKHTGPNKGFGVNHIWAEHSTQLIKSGYQTINDVARYVSDIIKPGTQVFCEFTSMTGKHRPTVLRSRVGMVVLEPKEHPISETGYIYTVVTAYYKPVAHGVLVGQIDKRTQ